MQSIMILQTPTAQTVQKVRLALEQSGIPCKVRYARKNRGSIFARMLMGGFAPDETRQLQYEIRVPKAYQNAAYKQLESIQFEEE